MSTPTPLGPSHHCSIIATEVECQPQPLWAPVTTAVLLLRGWNVNPDPSGPQSPLQYYCYGGGMSTPTPLGPSHHCSIIATEVECQPRPLWAPVTTAVLLLRGWNVNPDPSGPQSPLQYYCYGGGMSTPTPLGHSHHCSIIAMGVECQPRPLWAPVTTAVLLLQG